MIIPDIDAWTTYSLLRTYIHTWTVDLATHVVIKETWRYANPSLHLELEAPTYLAAWRLYLGSRTLNVEFGHMNINDLYWCQAYILQSVADIYFHTNHFLAYLKSNM